MKFKIVLAMAVALVASSAIQAQQVKVSTGGPKGTYHALFANIAEKCGDQMAMVEMPSDGSLTNLDRLTSKEAGAAFVQTDALFASAQGRDLGNIKTLVAFNKEAVHVITLSNTGLKSGGTLGFGKQDVTFNNVEDLNGYKLAAAGGSMITAQVVKAQGQINWTIVPVANTDAALSALKSGAVQGVMMVGGQPLGDVKALGSEYKLIGFRQNTIDLLKTVYTAEKLSYPKMSSSAVQSIATDALLVTRTYNTPDKLLMLANLRKCVLTHVPEWQDADGAHPAWSGVDVNNHGKWQFYQLPEPNQEIKKKR